MHIKTALKNECHSSPADAQAVGLQVHLLCNMDMCGSALKDASDSSEDWKAFLHLHCHSAPLGRFAGWMSLPSSQSLAEAPVLEQCTCNLVDMGDDIELAAAVDVNIGDAWKNCLLPTCQIHLDCDIRVRADHWLT